MHPHTVIRAARSLQLALDVLVATLLVLLVVTASADPDVGRVALGVAVVLFAAVYATGRVTVRVRDRPVDAARGAFWPAGAWVLALVVTWACLLLLGSSALWLAFPLLFLEMHVLGPRRGASAVVVTTALAVTGALHHGLASVGSVLGPVFGAVVAVGVVLGFEAVVRESQQRQAVIAELVRTRSELAAVERERATTAERERLAREIHDTLAQGLSSITLLLRAAEGSLDAGDTGTARDRVSLARETAHENLDEARRVVRALAPAPLGTATLVPALERLVEQVRARSTVDWHLTVSDDVRELPLTVEATLLRVAQSAVANVLQHAGASRADLTLSFLDEAVALDVVDDGVGFDPGRMRAEGDGGFGLPAMRSRVADLGGTLDVESSPASSERRGTAVAVTLPAMPEDVA